MKLSDDTLGLLYEKDGYAKIVLATVPLEDLQADGVGGTTETVITERERP